MLQMQLKFMSMSTSSISLSRQGVRVPRNLAMAWVNRIHIYYHIIAIRTADRARALKGNSGSRADPTGTKHPSQARRTYGYVGNGACSDEQ